MMSASFPDTHPPPPQSPPIFPLLQIQLLSPNPSSTLLDEKKEKRTVGGARQKEQNKGQECF